MIVETIRKKRDGHSLSADEIRTFVSDYSADRLPDYQAAALLMAIFCRGLDGGELAALTDAMLHSGDVLDFSSLPAAKVDKHSTGGVGDKISIHLAPAVAACGLYVPMISGRGLGHTGGTLDKLEAIPGFRIDLDEREFARVLGACGMSLIGQTERLAPADKRLYALRDVTGTVESIPLIAASIMSKKLAEGIDALVLDVKTGDGAFMQRLDDSRALAAAMVGIGRSMGKQMVALISRMDQPLGRAVGNTLEVVESVECLRGDGPADLIDLSVELAAEMVLCAGLAPTIDDARARCLATIADGTALAAFRKVIAAQGGDPRALDNPSLLPTARHKIEIKSPRSGFVHRLSARPIGHATMLLGAGRARVDSVINPAVGVYLYKKLGDRVSAGEPLCVVHADDAGVADATAAIAAAYEVGDGPIEVPSTIVERL